MEQPLSSEISKKEFTAVFFRQAMIFYRSDMIDMDYVQELLAEEFPKQMKALERKRSRKVSRRPRSLKRRSPQFKPDDLLTPDQAARVLGLSTKTLANLRSAGGGPLFIKLANRTIRYRFTDLQAFISQGVKQNTSQY
nr:helix-turn-helix domain-containing protein [uncultured Cohaesibacter sp.]